MILNNSLEPYTLQTQQFILYGTVGCHLCNLAEEILKELNLPYLCQDIMEDDSLLAQYEIKIPVLKEPNNNLILCWPFNTADVQSYIKKCNRQLVHTKKKPA